MSYEENIPWPKLFQKSYPLFLIILTPLSFATYRVTAESTVTFCWTSLTVVFQSCPTEQWDQEKQRLQMVF